MSKQCACAMKTSNWKCENQRFSAWFGTLLFWWLSNDLAHGTKNEPEASKSYCTHDTKWSPVTKSNFDNNSDTKRPFSAFQNILQVHKTATQNELWQHLSLWPTPASTLAMCTKYYTCHAGRKRVWSLAPVTRFVHSSKNGQGASAKVDLKMKAASCNNFVRAYAVATNIGI